MAAATTVAADSSPPVMTINQWLESIVVRGSTTPLKQSAQVQRRYCHICQEEEESIPAFTRSSSADGVTVVVVSPSSTRRSSPRITDRRWVEYPCHTSHNAHFQCAKQWLESRLGKSDSLHRPSSSIHPECPICRTVSSDVLVQSQSLAVLETEAELFAKRHFQQYRPIPSPPTLATSIVALPASPMAASPQSSIVPLLPLPSSSEGGGGFDTVPAQQQLPAHTDATDCYSSTMITSIPEVVANGRDAADEKLLEAAQKLIAMGCDLHPSLSPESKEALFAFAAMACSKMR